MNLDGDTHAHREGLSQRRSELFTECSLCNVNPLLHSLHILGTLLHTPSPCESHVLCNISFIQSAQGNCDEDGALNSKNTATRELRTDTHARAKNRCKDILYCIIFDVTCKNMFFLSIKVLCSVGIYDLFVQQPPLRAHGAHSSTDTDCVTEILRFCTDKFKLNCYLIFDLIKKNYDFNDNDLGFTGL